MKHVPKYLLPKIGPVSGTEQVDEPEKPGFVPFRRDNGPRRGRGRGRTRGAGVGGRGAKKKADPLKKFGR